MCDLFEICLYVLFIMGYVEYILYTPPSRDLTIRSVFCNFQLGFVFL